MRKPNSWLKNKDIFTVRTQLPAVDCGVFIRKPLQEQLIHKQELLYMLKLSYKMIKVFSWHKKQLLFNYKHKIFFKKEKESGRGKKRRKSQNITGISPQRVHRRSGSEILSHWFRMWRIPWVDSVNYIWGEWVKKAQHKVWSHSHTQVYIPGYFKWHMFERDVSALDICFSSWTP